MPCEDCNKSFTLLRRKKACSECKRVFCTNCLRRAGRDDLFLCEKCSVLTKRPISVPDLQKLKPKDLIYYLQSKHISTSGCVEKDELVNLVVIYANNSQFEVPPQVDPSGGACTNPFDQLRQTCTSLFSNFADKIATDLQQFQPAGQFKAQPAPAPTAPPQSPPPPPPPVSTEPRRSSGPGPSSGVQTVVDEGSPGSTSSFEDIGAVGGAPESPESEQWQFLSDGVTGSSTSNGQKHSADEDVRTQRPQRRRSDSDIVQGAKTDFEDILESLDVETTRNKACSKCNEAVKARIAGLRLHLDKPETTEEDNRRHLNEFLVFLESDNRHSIPHSPEERQQCDEATAAANLMSSNSGSPRIFDRSKRVNLSDIGAIDDFEQLSVKQLKELLTLNRVDYKGCCEKDELKERVIRLWRNHTANPIPDKLPADDLCKICMDAPIECIYLECGHLVACLACSKVLSECPVCRQYIARVVRFFRV